VNVILWITEIKV